MSMRVPLAACLAVLALSSPVAAQAHGDSGHRARAADRLLARGVTTWARPAQATLPGSGRRARLRTHPDRRVARLPRRPLGARASSVSDDLAATWCGVETATDRPNPLNSAPQIKVVYAHPSDVPSRLATYGGLIQSAARTAAQVVEDRAGGSRTLRFDVGCGGTQYLDIATVELPHTRDWYLANKQVDTDAIREALGLAAGEVNLLIWADDIGVTGDPVGVGQTILDDRPGKQNHNNYGGRDAIVIGRGKTYFFDDAVDKSWKPASVALHEVTHTLGAVQNGAPHSSKAGHCTDEWDIMCYADGSPTNPKDGSALSFTCPASASDQVYDCGGDDYFNVSPDPGSWLADHWNVAFSPFLCASAKCFATLQRPTVAPSPTSASPDLYEPVTIDAGAVTDDGPAPLVEWDVPGAFSARTSAGGRVLTATWDREGLKPVVVYVTDSDGNLVTETVPVNVVNRPPAAQITAPPTATAGAEVLLTARDTDRRPVARYRWDLDGAPGFELDTGANAWAAATFPAAGSRTVRVQLTDSGGASAEAGATIAVAAAPEPPAGRAPARKAPTLNLRLARGSVSRAALRRPLLLRVRSSVVTRLSLRVSPRRDGAAPLLRRSVVLRAGEWKVVRLRLPSRARALRSARALRISGTTTAGARGALVVRVR